mmetsp:Transcript_5972/g.24989  ORF Transcript_5972/g.24989 Transcript_5972/m.24989 type:complete len:874 (+) Transcript_5972:53-2674(+)
MGRSTTSVAAAVVLGAAVLGGGVAAVSEKTTEIPADGPLRAVLDWHLDRVDAYATKALAQTDRPLVFFHQRKAGGTTLRVALHRAAVALGKTAFIPCFGGVSCEIYDAPPQHGRRIDLLGGHLRWASTVRHVWLRSRVGGNASLGWGISASSSNDQEAARDGGGGGDPPPPLEGDLFFDRASSSPRAPLFDCLTLAREPVARVKSCWDYRFIARDGLWPPSLERRFDSLTTDEVRRLLPTSYSKFGEGCNNEPLRLFWDADETAVNRLTSEATTDDAVLNAAARALNATLSRQAHCVVGTLERCDDFKTVLEHRFAWLAPYVDCKARQNVAWDRAAKGGRHSKRGPPARSKKMKTRRTLLMADDDDDKAAEIRRQNVVEVAAYHFAQRFLDAQLRAVAAPPSRSALEAPPSHGRLDARDGAPSSSGPPPSDRDTTTLLVADAVERGTRSAVECHGRTVRLRSCVYRNVCVERGDVVFYSGDQIAEPLERSTFGVRLRNVNGQYYKGNYADAPQEVKGAWVPRVAAGPVPPPPEAPRSGSTVAVYYDFAFPAIWGHVLIDDLFAAFSTVEALVPGALENASAVWDATDIVLRRPCREAPHVTESEKHHGPASCRLSYEHLAALLAPRPARVVGDLATPTCYARLVVGLAGRAPALGMDWALLLDSRAHAATARRFFDRLLERLDALSPFATDDGRDRRPRLACLLSRSRRAVANLAAFCDAVASEHGLRVDRVAFPRYVVARDRSSSVGSSSSNSVFEDDLGEPFDLLARIQTVSRATVVVTPHGSLAFNSFFCRARGASKCLVFSVGAERETPLLTALPWLLHVNYVPDPHKGDAFSREASDGVRAVEVGLPRALGAFREALLNARTGRVASY